MDVVEDQLGCVGGVHAELVELARDREPRGIGVHQEQREALVSGFTIAPGDQDAEVRAGPVRDEGLLSVDDPTFARATSRGLDAGDIRPGVGFADAETGDLLSADSRDEVSLLLLLGTELEDRWRGHLALHGHRHPHSARAGPGHLLRHDDGVAPIAALAAVPFGIPDPQEPEVSHPLEHPIGEPSLSFPLLRVRRQLALDESADRGAEHLVFRREQGVQHGPNIRGQGTPLVPNFEEFGQNLPYCSAVLSPDFDSVREFVQEPAVRPYGVEAVIRDDSGNWFSFTQRHG